MELQPGCPVAVQDNTYTDFFSGQYSHLNFKYCFNCSHKDYFLEWGFCCSEVLNWLCSLLFCVPIPQRERFEACFCLCFLSCLRHTGLTGKPFL